MYEIKSCGVTLDFVPDRYQAQQIFDRAIGPEVILYKYNSDGNKFVVLQKLQNSPAVHSKSLASQVVKKLNLAA